ncbi:thrombospondin type-1 domain-containing protein 1 [Gadus chalcogrammus]|uniref:thrombospondin type-1 domain-containing protein 1 n=1 Tax=Gadus chalcogrammus TaxID=1042646 RepID=UPI0024C3EED0|nr:thrombospondin type-1 domain-containing protein 1 [Gadus chalcogrammus]XP_056449640.1 thrombospondin type-1 domain-containing protein 1 [Gadus chalcogrammus]XP_056449641.1 thrombospondin type-1 domain-containing protein 1 [Gadus chalcogrammus]
MAQRCARLLPFFLLLLGYAMAGLSIWPSLHIALSNASVFVDFITACNSSSVCNTTLSLVDTETNSTLLTRTLPGDQSVGRVEFNCSYFLYAGIFRFHLKQTAKAVHSHGSESTHSTSWWCSSELHVQWPTFHIGIERLANHSGSFQVGISTNEHFQGCSGDHSAALSLEVSYMEYNQIGRNSIDKVRVRTYHPIRALRSQSVELPCAFPFTEKDFVRVALRSPHTSQEVKSSGPLYLSRIFSYKLQVDDASIYRTGCDGTMTVRLLAPPCAAVNGKVQLYRYAAAAAGPGGGEVGGGGGGSGGSTMAGSPGLVPSLRTPLLGFGPQDEPFAPTALLAFNWLTHGENQTEFNCSVFQPGKNKYCFRFVFNYSRLPSPAQTCLVVHRSVESWGPWEPWSPCSVSCGEGLRERVRQCLSLQGVVGVRCPGMGTEQSPCSLEDCMVTAAPSPSPPGVPAGATVLGGNLMVVTGISLCLAVILATLLFTAWRKLCRAPPCSSVRQGSMHSTGGGRKLSDEASIFGNSLQRPTLMEPPGLQGMGSAGQRQTPLLGSQSLSLPLVLALPPDPDRLSPSGQKMVPPVFGYRLAQQQLKEMKKQGLTEATQVYHVSSSPVDDNMLSTTASPTATLTSTPTGLHLPPPPLPPPASPGIQEHHYQHQAAERRLSPREELRLGPPLPGYGGGGGGGTSRRQERTADWVEMVERSGMGRGGGVEAGNSSSPVNPHFRRTCSFTDAKPQPAALAGSRAFRERSMTQVASRTLPEGSCRARGIREGQPYPAFPSYPIPELGPFDWGPSTPKRTWLEAAAPGLSLSPQPLGTRPQDRHNTALLNGTVERDRLETVGCGPLSRGGPPQRGCPRNGVLCPPWSANQLALERAERAEQCWSRRGPSPIQRNILARRLKEAQACSGAPGGPGGRQRSATFSASTEEQRKGRCHSLPISGSPYRLSDAEQRMMDLDLPST